MKSVTMSNCHLLAFVVLLTALAGCPVSVQGPFDSNEPTDNTADNPAEQPLPTTDCVSEGGGGSALPAGELLFPVEGIEAAVGDVPLVWSASDADQEPLGVSIFVSDQEDVFDNPTNTQLVCLAGDTPLTVSSVRLADEGTYYWGIEITDGSNTTRRPADGVGEPFEVSATGSSRLGLEGSVLICPSDVQLARARTTFQWVLGEGIEPTRTQVFVGRPGEENPFDAALFIFDEVTPPTATSWTMPEGTTLPAGEALVWGLRIETADRVLFSVGGQGGQVFEVGDNVPPSGTLLAPDDGAVLADGDDSFVLSWTADPGNCEDSLTSTVYLEQLVDASEPVALFDSTIRIEVPAGGLETDIADRLEELGIGGGMWAWGVRASDGTDSTALPHEADASQTYRRFVRDTGPRFVDLPAAGTATCGIDGAESDAVVFAFADDNGAETVTVTISYAATEEDVFDGPVDTLVLPVQAAGGPVAVAMSALDDATCPVFAQGDGFYGVTLDDGVNPPVRGVTTYTAPPAGACCHSDGSCSAGLASACTGSYQGDGTTCDDVTCPQPEEPDPGPDPEPQITDCNDNGIEDAVDIAGGVSTDCDRNGVPDECHPGFGTDCNQNGVWDTCDLFYGTSPDCNMDGIPDECNDGNTTDCNDNGVWDACDIFNGTSLDCDQDGIPDECEENPYVDCNDNDVWDACDLLFGTSEDCNDDAVPDECNIASQDSADCNLDGIPDECGGLLLGDMNFDGVVDLLDLPILENVEGCWTGPCAEPPCVPPLYEDRCCAAGDFDFDGDVDLDDFAAFDLLIGG